MTRKNQSAKILFYLWSVIALFTFTKKVFVQNPQGIISPIPDVAFAEKKIPNRFQSLEQLVLQNLEDSPGDYGIVIKNLTTKETIAINEHKVFETGSLYKLWVMGQVYREIQNKKLSETEVLSRDIPSLNRAFGLSPDVAELNEGTITLSVKNALTQMITISHNYAALLLSEKIRLASATDFLNDFKFTESKIGTVNNNPTSTAVDIAKFYEMLYTGKLANPQYSEQMLDLLKAQKLNNKIPKYLPPQTVIAHKTGELGTYSHDAGILYTPKGDYILVILSDYGIPSQSEEFIATLSKSIYDFLVEN